jgi:DNA-binding LacI/PurR family transcriptional regulator
MKIPFTVAFTGFITENGNRKPQMSRPDLKAQSAAQMIRKRISHGDHALHGLPAERRLAEELGMSRQTVRRSLKLLEEEGTLIRRENGRLDVANAESEGLRKPVVGFVRYNTPSHDHEIWTTGIYTAIEGRNMTLRPMSFDHYAAPHLAAALSGFDAMFFLPPAERIPKWLIDRMLQEKCRVVVLDQDASDVGLPSIVMFPPKAEYRLLEHLEKFGHRRIDCLNSQPQDAIIEGRIGSWREFIASRGIDGMLFSLTEFSPLESAYQLVRNKLRVGGLFGTSLLCTTAPAAIGAMRAFYEAGVKVGRDVCICAVNDEGVGPYLVPSLTSLQSLPRVVYLRKALDWMLSAGQWEGPLLMQPHESEVPLFVGESTGPASAGAGVMLARAV